MSKRLRIAAVGAWHVHAREYAEAAKTHPDTELVALWDDHEPRGAKLASELAVPYVDDLDALLSRPDLDGITVTTSTAAHTDVISRALAAGKHVFTEKHLAPTVAEVDQLIAAAHTANRALVVSLPRLMHGYTLTIGHIISVGTLGTVTHTRIRISHDGWIKGWLPSRFDDPAEAIGGALFDLGAHPVYLSAYIHGAEPKTVTGSFGHVIPGNRLDDTAVATVTYHSGAIGVMESSMSDGHGEFLIEIHGTRGTLRYLDGVIQVWSEGDTDWREVPSKPDGPTPFMQWISHIQRGTPPIENLAYARNLTAVTLAAYEHATE